MNAESRPPTESGISNAASVDPIIPDRHRGKLSLTGDWGDALQCPSCGHGFTHLSGVCLQAKGRQYASTWTMADGTTARGPAFDAGTGPCVYLYGNCENGCEFIVRFIQHKGETYVTAEGRPAWLEK